ncbi:DnaJ domain-containing protein [Noviherbaspirillum humi]|uniref:DnaJ domain-containing protein n=1 Tax=Noviherbaspirillum humi TaxID=1688639 RepID=A0A239DLI4_9BURK|nr:DnaJ domain-containing protein [Noviherbaspirillum humi]
MAQVHTHYDNLKVARDAPPEVIRAAYKTLSQKYHPDRNPGNAEAIRIIQIINSAYEVLSDPVKRQEHDAWIARTEAGTGAFSQRGSGKPFFHGSSGMGAEQRTQGRHAVRKRVRRKSGGSSGSAMEKLRMMLGRFSRMLFPRM